MNKAALPRSTHAGYSLTEMMFVLGLMAVLGGMAAAQIGVSRAGIKGDGAMRVVLSQMNTARELAITQRRNMRVTFTAGNLVQTIREEAPGTATTVISSTLIEGGLEFLVITELPDTPDAFGKTSAVTFSTATGTPPEVKFTPDGTFVNQSGATLNGTVFVALTNQPLSARAVTVLGSTGRVRGYRWNGNAWNLV